MSLNEWAVLGVLVERPRHGYDIAAELRPGRPLGDVWRLTRQLVYRALERLEALGMAEPRRTEASDEGPPRTVFGSTRRGRASLRAWLMTPIEHLRDVRSVLLFKLVLLERLGLDRQPLISAQQIEFDDLLRGRTGELTGNDVIAIWRHHSASSVRAFLDALDDRPLQAP